MDTILKNKIIEKLKNFLNREPTENEIQNGITDSHLMGWIRDDELKVKDQEIKSLQSKIK